LLNSCSNESGTDFLEDEEVTLRMTPEEQQFVDDINLKTDDLDQMLRGVTNTVYSIETFVSDASLLLNVRYSRENVNFNEQEVLETCLTSDKTSLTAPESRTLYTDIYNAVVTQSNNSSYPDIRSIGLRKSDPVNGVYDICIITTFANTNGSIVLGTPGPCIDVFGVNDDWNYTFGKCNIPDPSNAADQLSQEVNNFILANPSVVLSPPPPYNSVGDILIVNVVDSTPFLSEVINPNDNMANDNYLDYLVFNADPAFPNYDECIPDDEMDFYYCAALDLLNDYNPNIYEYINISSHIFANGNFIGKKWHNFNSTYGLPVYYDWPVVSISDGPLNVSELKTNISGVL